MRRTDETLGPKMTPEEKVSRVKQMALGFCADAGVFVVIWCGGIFVWADWVAVEEPEWLMLCGLATGLVAKACGKWAYRKVVRPAG